MTYYKTYRGGVVHSRKDCESIKEKEPSAYRDEIVDAWGWEKCSYCCGDEIEWQE